MIEFILFSLIGFVAQIIDGALGMAYGVISMAFLLSLGIPPAAASACVHVSEMVTTGISGISHTLFKNIDYRLFRRLVIPGVLGGILGAYLLTKAPVNLIKSFICIYLLVMGILILYQALHKLRNLEKIRHYLFAAVSTRKTSSHHHHRIIPLGLMGGFCDALGGGGWGSIVTSSLLAQGELPRYAIGTANVCEFLVTVSVSTTFFLTIGVSHWSIIFGLLIGGAIAAPLAAYTIKWLPPRLVMVFAGTLVILINIRLLIHLFF